MTALQASPAEPQPQPPRLLDRVREAIRSSLAVDAKVSASTQNQALSALLFLYREVLDKTVPWLREVVHAKTPRRLPVVLTRDEVRAVLERLAGTPRLMATLLYGAGLRLLEYARLRVKDVNFTSNQILVRGGKGDKDRVTRQGGRPPGRCRQAGKLPHVPALLRNPFARGRLLHSNRPGTPGSPGCQHNDDLHPRAEPRVGCCAQPRRRPPEGIRSLVVGTRPVAVGAISCKS